MNQSLRLGSSRSLILALVLWALAPGATRANHLQCIHSLGTTNPIQILGVWHCGSTFCDWRAERDMAEFDARNRWLIDRGDGRPSVNLVVLSFVHPLRLMNRTTDAVTLNGVPRGMTLDVVNYFKNAGVRVTMSIGGITYTEAWNEALATNPTQLGLNAADVATAFGVGIEIDYEQNTDPNVAGLQEFIDAYRSVHPYDATGTNHAARLTIDLATGNRWLQALSRHASIHWLDPANPVLDYANAMVPGNGQPKDVCSWVEHINGIPEFTPPIAPKAPAKITGALWLDGKNTECRDFNSSRNVTRKFANFVQSVRPNGRGTSNGMAGYMYWAAECPSTRAACTTPPNTCEGGLGVACNVLNVPIPMPALRQQ